MKRKTIFRKVMAVFAVGLFLFSCEQQEIAVEQSKIETEATNRGGMIVLGKKLENPYSVENMKKAYNNLVENGRRGNNIDIATTHYYVRFLPKDTIEYDLISADITVELYDYPLDVEIKEGGNYYHDKSLPKDAITWQYTAVKKDYKFGNIEYEILDELFLPEAVEEEGIANGRTSFDFLYDLEDEALRITDNWEEPIIIDNGRCRRKCWTPSGRIQVSEITGNIRRRLMPVREVKVRARRWFTTKVDYTDRNGNYSIDEFRRSVNYSVAFSTQYAKITNYLGVGTFHNGPKRRSSWNVNFEDNVNHKNWVRATLVNAAHEFKQQYRRTGIYNPYPTDYWAGGQGEALNKLNIRAVFKEGTGDMWVPRLNKIRIWTEFTRQRGRKETDDLYAVTFHELGHSSHYKMTTWNIMTSSRILRESWAEFIEFYFTREYYPNHRSVNLNWTTSIPNYDASAIRESTKSAYTQVFVDLMDNDNQLNRFPGTDRADDRVRGYTFYQIQQVIKKSRQLEHTRNYLRDDYHNTTEGNLDLLFNFYLQF